MTVVGTRPEIIRLSRVISLLDKTVNHILVHTGQNYDYELNEIFFSELGLRVPKYNLDSAENSSSPAETIGRIIALIDPIISREAPDAFMVLGDTNSCLAALAAKKRKVPIFHLEAGNRCFDMRVPEEINRKIVDHLADINLPYSALARDYLIDEGIAPDTIIKIGSPMQEVLDFYSDKINASQILTSLGLKCGAYIVVSIHREENIEGYDSFIRVVNLLNFVAKQYGFPVIVSTHPRTRKKLDLEGVLIHDNVTFLKPLGFFDYVNLQIHSRLVLSDSGTLSEESSILGFNAINLRESHERPEAMEESVVMFSGLSIDRLSQCIELLDSNCLRTSNVVTDYSSKNVSDKVVKVIHSYIDYVNNKLWRKPL